MEPPAQRLEIGEVIATRILHLRSNVGSEKTLEIVIGKPMMFEDSSDYFCPYCIRRYGDNAVRFAGGVDSIQALQLAMVKLGAEVRAISASTDASLYWLEDGEDNIGLP